MTTIPERPRDTVPIVCPLDLGCRAHTNPPRCICTRLRNYGRRCPIEQSVIQAGIQALKATG